MTGRGKVAEPVYRTSLQDLMLLEDEIRHLTLDRYKSDPFKHKIDDVKSSYDPLLREAEVIKVIRKWREGHEPR